MTRFLPFLLIALFIVPQAYAHEHESHNNPIVDEGVKAEGEIEVAADSEAVALETTDLESTEKSKPIAALPDDDFAYEERLELSREMHKIWPMRLKIENALDIVSGQIDEEKRAAFKSSLRKSIKFDALEQASIDAMADIFSVAELNRMIEFYGSKEGRSVSEKITDYEQALQPLMSQMMDKALMDARLGSQ